MYSTLITGIKNKLFDSTYVLNMTNWNVGFNIFGAVFNTYTNLTVEKSWCILTLFLLPLEGRNTIFQNSLTGWSMQRKFSVFTLTYQLNFYIKLETLLFGGDYIE